MQHKIIIGLDFDNTIVRYDHVFKKVAAEQGWLEDVGQISKRQIRALVHAQENGEGKWQHLQAEAYGSRMHEAELMDGVREFLSMCDRRRARVCVISHKTEYANYNPTGVNLREAAFKWIEHKKLNFADGKGTPSSCIYFENTRESKVARIRSEGCTHFVDDLIEVLEHDDFPVSVRKYLFAPGEKNRCKQYKHLYESWSEISDDIFHS